MQLLLKDFQLMHVSANQNILKSIATNNYSGDDDKDDGNDRDDHGEDDRNQTMPPTTLPSTTPPPLPSSHPLIWKYRYICFLPNTPESVCGSLAAFQLVSFSAWQLVSLSACHLGSSSAFQLVIALEIPLIAMPQFQLCFSIMPCARVMPVLPRAVMPAQWKYICTRSTFDMPWHVILHCCITFDDNLWWQFLMMTWLWW